MNNQTYERLTGLAWSQKFGITILDPKGWKSKTDFENTLISKNQFFNFAAASEVKKIENVSRRSIKNMFNH